MITIVKIKKQFKTSLEIAVKYYSILSILNDFKLSLLEIRLLAFASVKGNLSSGGTKETFCELFKASAGSVSNSISKLYFNKFLIKEGDKTKINPELNIDCSSNLLLQIRLDGNS